MKEFLLYRKSKNEPEIISADFYKNDPQTGEIQFFRESPETFVATVKGTDYYKMIEKDKETGEEKEIDPNHPEI